ncbi:FHA domain-containing protein [Leucobacter viscericola]|uniref:FHA domain-containing protein n=1 Tax=Leucobacter viscericola TaxID=2714935 RepID=A0A6G7XDU5_9MICO|nr:FtsK/SpoIIIE domain-containing protein [Leucobacter viscericola]QIK62548.1 FHA domain-containing protein [Leucobacter viscericola]
MKLRVTLTRLADHAQRQNRDVTLTADVTATVGEVASGLARAGAGDPQLLPFAMHRQAPLTLKARFADRGPLILDSGDPIGESGLQPGSGVEPVFEAAPGEGARAKVPVAILTVLEGVQKGISFVAVQGENPIGRDRSNRIELHERSVSRRHAVLRTTSTGLDLEDLGSANGIGILNEQGLREEQRSRVLRIDRSCVVEIGTVKIRIDVGPPAKPQTPLSSSVLHLQSPQVDPVFTPDPIELPAPPDPPDPGRFPIIAMISPLLMGVVLYFVTQSMMSLVFIALSPLIMLSTWVDTRLTQRKTLKRKKLEFEEGIALAREELALNFEEEQKARNAETPTPEELLPLPSSRSRQLWTRRAEHRAFLELRLGKATLPSRKEIKLPPRGKITANDWSDLTDLHDKYNTVPNVPVLERLDRCGSLAVAGPPLWAGSVTRSLLIQLLALHSPADLVFTAFASESQANDEWAWLKWIPHVDSAYSPLNAPHLVADERSAGALLTSLEGLIMQRAESAKSSSLRSRIEGSASDVSERLAPASNVAPTPAVIVLVLSDTIVDRTRLVGLAEDGADVGVHVLWLAPHIGAVPAACRTIVEVQEHSWQAHFVRQGESVPLTHLDFIDSPLAETFARALAPVVDAGARVLDESDFPRSVALGQIVSEDILGSRDAVLRNWEHSDSLVADWTPGAERDSGQLSAIVGQGSAGPVEIDLRTHGPHALVGGTTGSGKSEFLQTWILSLAANYAPDRLTFLLVDYKGGAAFADCVDLPHTVGLVTDLNTHLVRRALTSLRAELRYREELLAEKSAKDLIALERRGDPDAPPTLIIVIDEFAALVNEIPDFVDGVIDVAQRGRSLGLHLVMATQRPAGVIKDNLRANTNLRIGLRMADPADSSDVLGVKDAAFFAPETPGRAAVKVGAGRLTHFQAAYLGGRAESDHQEAVEIRDLVFGEHAPWALQPEIRQAAQQVKKGPRDIELLAENIRAASHQAALKQPRRPWVDQLPEVLPLTSLQNKRERSGTASEGFMFTLGLIDEPHLQRQSPYRINFSDVGNMAIFGGSGSGKTSALITTAVSAIERDSATRVFGLDMGGGRLSALTQLPNTGDVVPADEKDRVARLLGMLARTAASRVAGQEESAPPILLLLDGFATFRDVYEHASGGVTAFQDLVEIARSGRNVGIHVVLASERSANLPAALAASVPERLTFFHPSEADYQLLGVPAAALEDAPPGRAIRIGSDEEIQFALPSETSDPSDIDVELGNFAHALREEGVAEVEGIPEIPLHIARSEIVAQGGSMHSFAIDTVQMDPVDIPESGMLLVTGPAGSGRTTTIRTLIETCAHRANATGQRLEAVLISPRRSKLRDLAIWSSVADTPDTREAVIERLTLALGGRKADPVGLAMLPLIGDFSSPDPVEVPEPLAPVPFPLPGAEGLVVIEDIGGFDGSGNEDTLATLLKLLRRSEHTVIVEGENATLSTVWELATPLRGARWAIALQPDANDAPSIFTTPFTYAKRADYPPGRGLLARNGTLTGIHVGAPVE